MKKPLIGVTLDRQEKGDYSKRPHYAMRVHYFNTIEAAGGMPIALPLNQHLVAEYAGLIDGLISPGGGLQKPADWYVQEPVADPFPASPRLAFDVALMQAMLALKKPLLGICEGMQILSGLSGCKLTRNLPHHCKTVCDHLNEKPLEERAHRVTITPGSKLHTITGKSQFMVNSAHREGVLSTPTGITVAAQADDGVIEAIELENHPFALGVQWHPEMFPTPDTPDFALFQAFITAAQKA